MVSCSLFKKEAPKASISAKVNDFILFTSQVEEAVPRGLTKTDSLSWIKKYVESWVAEKSFLAEAYKELPSERKDFTDKLKEYEQSLIQHSFEDFLAEKADLNVSELQIASFYSENSDQFQIVDPLIQCKYVILDKKAPRNEFFINLMSSNKLSDLKKMDDYFFRYALQFSLNDSIWQKADLISMKLNNLIEQDKMQPNKDIVTSDSLNIYAVFVKKRISSGGQAPYIYVREQAKQFLQLTLRSKYVENVKKEIYSKALSKNNIEIISK